MNPKQVGAIRRAVIYFVVGYGGLAVINNAGIAPERMWMAYLPLFIGVYFLLVGRMRAWQPWTTTMRMNESLMVRLQ